MDKKELLRTVVNSIINEDDAGAKEAFSQYTTLRARDVINGTTSDEVVTEEQQEEVAEKTEAEQIAEEIVNSETE